MKKYSISKKIKTTIGRSKRKGEKLAKKLGKSLRAITERIANQILNFLKPKNYSNLKTPE